MLARRRLLLGTCAAQLAIPGLIGAQPKTPVQRIGLIHVGDDHMPPSYEPMRAGMRALGYEVGRNIRYDFRNVADEIAALEAARAFVRERVDLIVAFDQEACSAAHMATTTLPELVLVHHLVVHHGLDQARAAQQCLDLDQRFLRLIRFHRLGARNCRLQTRSRLEIAVPRCAGAPRRGPSVTIPFTR